MKTKQWLFAALTVLLLAGCSTETDLTRTDDVDPSIPAGMTQLNFDIKGVRTGTSYVALTPDEAQLKNMVVVLFPQSESGPQPEAVSVAALKAKVTTKDGVYKAAVLIDKTIPAGKYYAALMANIDVLIGSPGVTDADLNAFCGSIKGISYSYLFLIDTRALLKARKFTPVSYGLGMKALVKDINVTEADRGDIIPLKATLTRPVARFDIKNTAYKSFTITSYKKMKVRNEAFLRFLDSDAPQSDGTGILDDENPVVLTDAEKTLLNTPSLDHDGDAATDLVMTYNPAFYLYPGLAADESYVEITGDLKVSTGGTRTVTYTIPLKTKNPDAYIAIESNKRYKIELKMTETEQLVGDVSMDAGSWDDEGGGTGNDNIEEQLPGEIVAVTGATYDAATKTFNVAEDINTFSFNFVVSTNTLRVAATAPGIVNKVEEATTLVAPNAKYTVTLATTGYDGNIEEMGKDKDGKDVVINTYQVKRAGAPLPPADVNGHTPVLYNGFWFVDPSEVGRNNQMLGMEQALAACPSGWHIPTKAELIQIVGIPTTPGWGEGGWESEDFVSDFFVKIGMNYDDGVWTDETSQTQLWMNATKAWWGKDAGTAARCIQAVN